MIITGKVLNREVEITFNPAVILSRIENIDWEEYNDNLGDNTKITKEELDSEVKKLKNFLDFLSTEEGKTYMLSKVVLTKSGTVNLKTIPVLYSMGCGRYSLDYYGWFNYKLRLEPEGFKNLTVKLKEIVVHY